MKKSVLFYLLSALLLGCFVNVKAQRAQREENPANILVSYYDAINNKQFRRAYNYWKNPNQSYAEFVRGYDDTRSVRLITNPDIPTEGGAGSLYKSVPTVLISTMKNGSRQIFYGCYILRKINLRPPDIPKEDTWHIERGDLKSAPVNSDTKKLLREGCGDYNDPPPVNDNPGENSSRILGVLGSDSNTAYQSISVPPNVQANRDFEITVTTSGSGCVSAGETSVILGEMNADVFVYDFTSANRPGIMCTMIFKTFSHKATLRFANKGEAVIRVWGRRQGGGSILGEPTVIEKRVSVR